MNDLNDDTKFVCAMFNLITARPYSEIAKHKRKQSDKKDPKKSNSSFFCDACRYSIDSYLE